jgi:hypothetical protein
MTDKDKIKKDTVKVEKEEFFTDEMHANIYVFTDHIPSGRFSSGKPIVQSVKFSKVRRGSKK